jgi:hypothetical protein
MTAVITAVRLVAVITSLSIVKRPRSAAGVETEALVPRMTNAAPAADAVLLVGTAAIILKNPVATQLCARVVLMGNVKFAAVIFTRTAVMGPVAIYLIARYVSKVIAYLIATPLTVKPAMELADVKYAAAMKIKRVVMENVMILELINVAQTLRLLIYALLVTLAVKAIAVRENVVRMNTTRILIA